MVTRTESESETIQRNGSQSKNGESMAGQRGPSESDQRSSSAETPVGNTNVETPLHPFDNNNNTVRGHNRESTRVNLGTVYEETEED